jgi:hypothetical protein
MHNFTILAVDGLTVLFCAKCGKSYKLATYGYGGETKAWKEISFRDSKDQAIDAPSQDCDTTTITKEEK